MIDILGMLLPGGFMLLLLESDLHMLNHLRTALGIEADKLLWAIVFLCLSYFVGMLLHEIGSIIEKILWSNPFLNPRVYVAAAIGLMDIYQDKVEEQKKTWYRVIDGSLRLICTFILAVTVVVIALGFRKKLWEDILVGSLVVILVALVTQRKRFFDKRFRDKENWKRMWAIIRDEDKIRKNSGTNDENARKLGLFSGYYSLLRSVLMVLVILQIFVYLQPTTDVGGIRPWLWVLDNTIIENRSFLFLRYLIVLFVVLRYWHYSCSRFLYIYKGYIENAFTKPAEAVANIADRPIFVNAKSKEEEAQKAVKMVKDIFANTEMLKQTVIDAKNKADDILRNDPNDSTASQLSKLAEDAILWCDCVKKKADQAEKALTSIADNVAKLSEANCVIEYAAKAVDKSSETIVKSTVDCLQLEKYAKDKSERVIELMNTLTTANP